MQQKLKKSVFFLLAAALILSVAVFAQNGDGKTSSEQQKQVKQQQIKGVEITAVNSTVQDGVKPGTQINLEKVLKLMSQPKPKPKPKPVPAAGLGKRKPKPKPVPGGKDGRPAKKDRERLNTGS